jgi:hypothetical protein
MNVSNCRDLVKVIYKRQSINKLASSQLTFRSRPKYLKCGNEDCRIERSLIAIVLSVSSSPFANASIVQPDILEGTSSMSS